MSEIFIYEDADGQSAVQVRLDGETVWLTQKQMSELFGTTSENIIMHLKRIFADAERNEKATTKDFLAVQTEGRRQVSRTIKHFNLDAIISVVTGSIQSAECVFVNGPPTCCAGIFFKGTRSINPAWPNSGSQKLSKRWNCSPGHSKPMPC